MQAQVQAPSLSQASVNQVVETILETLGAPETTIQEKALAAFRAGDADTCRILAASNLNDGYCKTIGYLAGTFKIMPQTPTLLAEAARSAADVSRERTLNHLGAVIAGALS